MSIVIAVIYLAFISLGLPDSLLGAGWPAMHSFLNVPVSWAGIISMIISGCTILSSLGSDMITRRFGASRVTFVSICMTAGALFGFSVSYRFWMLCLWAVPYGLGAGSIDAALNNYVALHYSSRHMSWLHCFWGVGTIISPYVMSYALIAGGWQTGYRTIAVIQAVIAVITAFTLPLWGKADRADEKGETKDKPMTRGETVKIPGVASLLTGFFCYCAAESTCMLWTATFLTSVRGVSAQQAAAFASLFFIGITSGRLLSGFVSDRFGDRKMIIIGTVIAATGVLLVALGFLPKEAALAGFVIIGLGCAPIYPSIIHATPANFGAEHSQAIIGIQMASAYTGSMFIPPLFGVISSWLGMEIRPYFLAVFLILMSIMLRKTFVTTGNSDV